MRKIFFFISVLSLIFISPVAFSQEATTTDQGSDQTQVIDQEPTQTVETEETKEVEEETEQEKMCAGLHGLKYRKCLIKTKKGLVRPITILPVEPSPIKIDQRLKIVPTNEVKEMIEEMCADLSGLKYRKCLIRAKTKHPVIKERSEELSEKFIEEHLRDLKENIKDHLVRTQNIFVMGPAGKTLVAGKIQSVSNNTLTVNTLGFLSQWDISNAKIVKVPGGEGNISDLEVGRRVRVIGRWDSEHHILVAEVVIVKSPVETVPPVEVKPPEKTPKLPAPVPVILQQILRALRERGIEINLPQR